MTYSEALFFIGKCLTLGKNHDVSGGIKGKIDSGFINWDRIVWVSTSHFVFPALYLQLKRANLLPELPPELVEYMEEFTAANRKKNQLIKDQIVEISGILREAGITPVFLKGAAHLIDGLYEDIGERMVGDIDLLVDAKDMVTAGELLISRGYEPLAGYNPKNRYITKHYPRLKNDNRTAAVEVHQQIVYFPYYHKFDAGQIMAERRTSRLYEGVFVPADRHQIIHNILNTQIGDNAWYYGQLSLRQIYDLLLLSNRMNPLEVVEKSGLWFNMMNGNLALSNKILGNPECLPYKNTTSASRFINRVRRHVENPTWARFSHFYRYLWIRFSSYPKNLIRSIYNREARVSMLARLGDPKWYLAHLRS